MSSKIVICLSILIAGLSSSAFSQEQYEKNKPLAREASWQKQCTDKADGDKLDPDLRETFMTECIAGAKLDTALELKAREGK